MRLRKNKQGEAALSTMPGVLIPGENAPKLDWSAVFGRKAKLHVEIGVGKGDFIRAAAAKNPSIDYIGIERMWTVLYIAAKKNQARPLSNLRLLPLEARELASLFDPGQVQRIYLNFSDPWPKNRHAHRRLTAPSMLSLYGEILAPGGQIQLKTDQEAFFAYSIGECLKAGWSLGKITRDLYRSGMEDNIQTEYERRFTDMGHAICRLEAWRPGRGQDR